MTPAEIEAALRLAETATQEPNENHDCMRCYAAIDMTAGRSEPTPLCDECAQECAPALADAVVRLAAECERLRKEIAEEAKHCRSLARMPYEGWDGFADIADDLDRILSESKP